MFNEYLSHEIDEWSQYNLFEGPLNFIKAWKLASAIINTFPQLELHSKK